jgi:hypothetical protein
MLLDQEYNINDLPEQDEFDVIPAGWYQAVITEAEVKTTKSGSGQYIAIRYDVTGPTHEGRVVFGNLNIRNDNPVAEQIGMKQMRGIMAAGGLSSVKNSDQFCGIALQIKVKISKSEEYGDKNEVADVRPLSGSSMPHPASAPKKSENAQQKKPGSAPPWAKK